jgi:hypothetical protein
MKEKGIGACSLACNISRVKGTYWSFGIETKISEM